MLKQILIATASLAIMAVSVPAQAADTLYDDLGGQDALVKIVDQMMVYSLADSRIAESFDNTNIERFKPILVEHFCALTDGPCTYEGQDMKRVHTGLDIKTFQFNALVENLQKSMRDADVPFKTQNRLLAILAPMHSDVVGIPYETRP